MRFWPFGISEAKSFCNMWAISVAMCLASLQQWLLFFVLVLFLQLPLAHPFGAEVVPLQTNARELRVEVLRALIQQLGMV